MKGKARAVSLARKLVIDILWASVPFVVIERTMRLDRVVAARASLAERPSWAAIITKAFCIVAREEPWLRTFYLRWPWPHFYELPKSVAMITFIRDSIEKDALLFIKVRAADEMPLREVHDHIRRGNNGDFEQVASLKWMLRLTRCPLLLRRAIWTLGLNIGRQRANYFGSFGVTSIAALGSETVVLRAPGPSVITYGMLHPDHTLKIRLHWDHRIYDGRLGARALKRLEEVLNTEIADEMQQGRLGGNVSSDLAAE